MRLKGSVFDLDSFDQNSDLLYVFGRFNVSLNPSMNAMNLPCVLRATLHSGLNAALTLEDELVHVMASIMTLKM